MGTPQKANTPERRKFYSAAGGIVLLLTVLAYGIIKHNINKRVSQINGAAAEVLAGNPMALGKGEVSPALLEAVGEAPPDQQPRAVQEALHELAEAILSRASQLHNNPDLTASYQEALQGLLIVSGTRVEPGVALWEGELKPHLTQRELFLSRWLQIPESATNQRLEQLGQAFKTASETKDAPFIKKLHQTKIEIWETLIASAGEDITSRIKIIRRLIKLANEQDKQLRLSSRIFLGAQTAHSLMADKAESEIINQTLVDLRPNLSILKEGGLRFTVVLSSITSCESGNECKIFMERLRKALDDLEKLVKDRQPIIETTLQELLQNLPSNGKQRVWEEMLDEIGSSYLFTVESGAWPGDLEPLHVRARRTLNHNTKRTSALLEEFLNRLVWLPIYETEVRYLLRATETRWARQRLIENCHASLLQLRVGSYALPSFNFRVIYERLRETQVGHRFDWDVVPGSTMALSAEADQIYRHLTLYRRSGLFGLPRSSGISAADLTADLKPRLLAHCRALADTKPEVCNGY